MKFFELVTYLAVIRDEVFTVASLPFFFPEVLVEAIWDGPADVGGFRTTRLTVLMTAGTAAEGASATVVLAIVPGPEEGALAAIAFVVVSEAKA